MARGILIFGDARYEGLFVNGKPNGKGTLTIGTRPDRSTAIGQMDASMTANIALPLAFRCNPALSIGRPESAVFSESSHASVFWPAIIGSVYAAAIHVTPTSGASLPDGKTMRWVNFKKAQLCAGLPASAVQAVPQSSLTGQRRSGWKTRSGDLDID